MADNFDLKKFLKESKALENLNTIIGKNTSIYEGNMRDKIREMILAELGNPDDYDSDSDDDYGDDESSYYPHMRDLEDEYSSDELEEAKKKKEEEDVEVTDTETEEIPAEDAPIEDIPADEAPIDGGGGIEDLAADMKGTEADLMDHLMKAFQIAKGMNNEKLETQVGNTLKFFVSEYIGGGQQ